MSDPDARPADRKRNPPRESLHAPQVDPVAPSKADGFYLVGGVVFALVLIVGLMFFSPGSAPAERNDQARPPDRAADRTPGQTIEAPVQTPPNSVTPGNPQR